MLTQTLFGYVEGNKNIQLPWCGPALIWPTLPTKLFHKDTIWLIVLIGSCTPTVTHCKYMVSRPKHRDLSLATNTSCTALCGCWILGATYLTAVMNKTTATWSCACVCVCVCVCVEVLLTWWLLNELLWVAVWLAAWQLLVVADGNVSACNRVCMHDNLNKNSGSGEWLPSTES